MKSIQFMTKLLGVTDVSFEAGMLVSGALYYWLAKESIR